MDVEAHFLTTVVMMATLKTSIVSSHSKSFVTLAEDRRESRRKPNGKRKAIKTLNLVVLSHIFLVVVFDFLL